MSGGNQQDWSGSSWWTAADWTAQSWHDAAIEGVQDGRQLRQPAAAQQEPAKAAAQPAPAPSEQPKAAAEPAQALPGPEKAAARVPVAWPDAEYQRSAKARSFGYKEAPPSLGPPPPKIAGLPSPAQSPQPVTAKSATTEDTLLSKYVYLFCCFLIKFWICFSIRPCRRMVRAVYLWLIFLLLDCQVLLLLLLLVDSQCILLLLVDSQCILLLQVDSHVLLILLLVVDREVLLLLIGGLSGKGLVKPTIKVVCRPE